MALKKPKCVGKKIKIMKDWTGNKNSVYKTLGASNHTDKERQIVSGIVAVLTELTMKDRTFYY